MNVIGSEAMAGKVDAETAWVDAVGCLREVDCGWAYGLAVRVRTKV